MCTVVITLEMVPVGIIHCNQSKWRVIFIIILLRFLELLINALLFYSTMMLSSAAVSCLRLVCTHASLEIFVSLGRVAKTSVVTYFDLYILRPILWCNLERFETTV